MSLFVSACNLSETARAWGYRDILTPPRRYDHKVNGEQSRQKKSFIFPMSTGEAHHKRVVILGLPLALPARAPVALRGHVSERNQPFSGAVLVHNRNFMRLSRRIFQRAHAKEGERDTRVRLHRPLSLFWLVHCIVVGIVRSSVCKPCHRCAVIHGLRENSSVPTNHSFRQSRVCPTFSRI